MPVCSYSSQRTVFRSWFSPSTMWAPQVELTLLGFSSWGTFLALRNSHMESTISHLFPSFAVFQFHWWMFSFVAWTISSNFLLLRDYLVKVLERLISLHFCLFDYTVLNFFIWTCFIFYCFYSPIKVFPLSSPPSYSSSSPLLLLLFWWGRPRMDIS